MSTSTTRSFPSFELPKIDWSKVELPKIDWSKVELPKIEFPAIDLTRFDVTKFEFPKVDLPKVELPDVDLPKVDLPDVDLDVVADKVTSFARDAAYVGIGLAVLAVQQTQARGRDLQSAVEDGVRKVVAAVA